MNRQLHVSAISPLRLDTVRAAGEDGHGNHLHPFAAEGEGEPLRCCLRFAEAGESIFLMSYAPFERASVWREVGPVYVHAEPCDGYTKNDQLPDQLATGPRILRTYGPDGSMNYDHNTVVGDEAELRPLIEDLLAEAGVALVHVRTLAPQCFLYAVTGSGQVRSF